MARIFADEDIETLIHQFPPLNITNNKARPVLVSSSSNRTLVNLAKVLSRFETLLGQHHERISKSDIPSLLGVEKGSEHLILDGTSVFIYLSRDGRSIIPFPLADTIHETLDARASKSFVDIDDFAAEQDILSEGISRWVKFDTSKHWRTFDVDKKTFLCKRSLSDDIESKIRYAITTAGSEVCDVTDVFDDDVQTPILKELVDALTKGQDGDVSLERGHVVWIPTDYSSVVEERARTAQIAHIQQLTSELEDNRYCVIESPFAELDTHAVEEQVRDLFRKWHPDHAELRGLDLQNQPGMVLVDNLVLEHELKELKLAAAASAVVDFQRQENLGDGRVVMRSLLEDSNANNSRSLSALILRTALADDLEQVIEAELERLTSAERDKLIQMIESKLVLPLQLYTIGISTIQDPTLKQRQEDFVYEHFRKEVAPQALRAASDLKALREKSTQREVEKLRQAIMDAKSLAALQTGISKFSKKMKMTSPSESMLQTAKIRTTQQSLKSMRQMTRGSDLLQNLIWLLLAQKSEGLYMSAGKDTSRMIKQYEAVGDAGMTAKLVKWKNLLKAGQESKEDLSDMRKAAKAAIDEMIAPEAL